MKRGRSPASSPKKVSSPKKAASPVTAKSPAKSSPKKPAAAEARPIRTVTPSISIAGGKAAEAIAFYIKAFGAKEVQRMEGPGGVVTHAEVTIGDSLIFVSDQFGPPPPTPPKSSLHLQVDNSDKWFDRAVKAGCSVQMPLDDQFWGDRYGRVTDPFGNEWSIAHPVKQLSFDEVMAAQAEWLASMAKQGEQKGAKPAAAKKAKPAAKAGKKGK